jgi:tetratricopeptide (TPR) repeat protein
VRPSLRAVWPQAVWHSPIWSSPTRRLQTLLLSLVLLASTLAHLPAWDNGYTMDDRPAAHPYLSEGVPNPRIASLQPLSVYFGTHYWHGHKESSPLYRPLTTLSFALVEASFGDGGNRASARAQHILNIGLHVLATALVWLLLGALRAPPLWRALGALTFGTHVVRTEVVSGIVGRAELLAFVFGALALHCVLRSSRAPALRCWLWRILAAALLFLGFSSKESGLAWILLIPALWLLISLGQGENPGRKSILRSCALSFAIAALPAALFFWLRANALEGLEPASVLYLANPLAHVELRTRIATAFELIGYALTQSLAPTRISSDYGPALFEISDSLFSVLRLLGIGFLLGLAAVTITAPRRNTRLLLVAAIWLIAYLPVANLAFPIGTIYGERLLYTPLLSISLLMGLGAMLPRTWQAPALALCLCWTIFCGYRTPIRAGEWRSNEVLGRIDVERNPESARLQLSVGALDFEAGNLEAARQRFEKALALFPDYPEAHFNLASFAQREGDRAAAAMHLRRVIGAPTSHPKRHVYIAARLLLSLASRPLKKSRGLLLGEVNRLGAVTDNRPICHEDHVLGNVGGKIRDPLEIPGRRDQTHPTLDEQ